MPRTLQPNGLSVHGTAATAGPTCVQAAPCAAVSGWLLRLLLEQEVAKLEAEDVDTEREQDVRRKQFALLLHAVDDLQRALVDEPLETPAAAADPNTNATPMSIG
eukprot:scaffold795_cov375-Prasinococcus_capsulatus_cf.AAC.29